MQPHKESHTACRSPRGRGSCPKPNGGANTLTELVQEYKREKCKDHYSNISSLTEAIKHATGLVGKVPPHQRRVGRAVLRKAYNRLLRHKDKIEACVSFDDLLNLIESLTADIQRFGKLAVYDTAKRLGIYLKLKPEYVYLHTGTAKGAKALGLDTSWGYLEMDELPKPLRLLNPGQCEDFLCIYKADLAKLKRKT